MFIETEKRMSLIYVEDLFLTDAGDEEKGEEITDGGPKESSDSSITWKSGTAILNYKTNFNIF